MEVILKISISQTKDIELTEQEAQELYNKLHSMFGNKPLIPYPSDPFHPRIYPWTNIGEITYTDGDSKWTAK